MPVVLETGVVRPQAKEPAFRDLECHRQTCMKAVNGPRRSRSRGVRKRTAAKAAPDGPDPFSKIGAPVPAAAETENAES